MKNVTKISDFSASDKSQCALQNQTTLKKSDKKGVICQQVTNLSALRATDNRNKITKSDSHISTFVRFTKSDPHISTLTKSYKKEVICQRVTNLSNRGLISEDRSSKATLLFTIPRSCLSRMQRIYLRKFQILIIAAPHRFFPESVH